VLARAVLLLVDREIALGRPARGVEASAELLDGFGYRRHVGRDDDRAASLDDPLDHVGGVSSSGTPDVEHPALEADDGDGGRRPGVDADDDVIAALDGGSNSMPSRRSRSISTRTSPDRLRETGMSLGRAWTVKIAFAKPP